MFIGEVSARRTHFKLYFFCKNYTTRLLILHFLFIDEEILQSILLPLRIITTVCAALYVIL